MTEKMTVAGLATQASILAFCSTSPTHLNGGRKFA
jgi:hypothetical protein